MELVDHVPERSEFEGNEMGVTEKGRVYIEAILAVPLPVQRWVTAGERG